PSDQGLRRGGAASHVDQLHIETLIPEMTTGAGYLVGRSAENVAAERELNCCAFGGGLRRATSQQRRCAGKQRRALQHAAPGHKRRLVIDFGKADKAVGFAAV